MVAKRTQPTAHAATIGRQRLIDAALRLGAEKSSMDSVGLRELARAAGLNPNTFYRHFKDLDELGLSIVEHFGAELRADRNAARNEATDFSSFLRNSLARYFSYAARHRNAFILGFRELSSQNQVGRAVRKLMSELAQELVLIMRHFQLLTQLDDTAVAELGGFIISQLFVLTLEYIEHPKRRAEVLERALRFVAVLHRGAADAPNTTSAAAKRAKPTKSRPRTTR